MITTHHSYHSRAPVTNRKDCFFYISPHAYSADMDSSKTMNVTVNLPLETGKKLAQLVSKSGVTRSHYMRLLVDYAISQNVIFTVKMQMNPSKPE